MVALPPNHPLADRTRIDLRSLANESFVLCPKSVKPDLYSQIVQLCERAGFQPRIVQEASPPEVLLGLVASGMGISLVGAGASTRHNVGIVYRSLNAPTPILEIAAAWLEQPNSLVLNNFLTLMKHQQSSD